MRKNEKQQTEVHGHAGILGAFKTRLVNGFGKTGFYRPTALLVKPYINLAVTVHNHPFFTKTGIFEYFEAFFFRCILRY
jgi:hypothetical protein